MEDLTSHDAFQDTPEYPLYFVRFEELYEPLTNYQLNATAQKIINKIAWDFVLFTHTVVSKSFLEAISYLQKIKDSANNLINELHEQDPSAVIKIQDFTQSIQKQYKDFLFKKKLLKN